MAPPALCSDIAFTVAQHLTRRDDFFTWRGLCRHIEPQITRRLLATLTSPLNLRSISELETFHSMAFRGGSHRGRLAWFTAHVELSIGRIPRTHLQLVLDIFEHAQGITSLSVKDFDTTLSSFLLPADSTTALVNGAGQVESSDTLARRLLACWTRNRSLTKLSIYYRRICPAVSDSQLPHQWRSDAILEKERFPFVTDLSIHLGGKPIGKWYRGWRSAFPNMTRLTLSLGNGEQGRRWPAIRTEMEPMVKRNALEVEVELEEEGGNAMEVAGQVNEGGNEETSDEGEGSRPEAGEAEADEIRERDC